jgi:signal transduction histidine kinase
LGGLLYGLPMRAMGRAEGNFRELVGRLRESQAALGKLNETLEQQVEERSAELRDALAELQRKEQNLREISARAIGMQEAERRAIARELHDSAGQALTAVRIHVQLIGDLLAGREGEDAKTTTMARRTLAMVDDTVEEIRRAVNQLGPAVLDDVGLEAAITRAADDLSEATGVDVQCHYTVEQALDASVETTVYRLVQESLTNVARHAEASEVTIDVHADAESLEVSIRDDGKGFDPEAVGPRRRGLVGMRERVALLGGEVSITSAVGKGTQVQVALPLTAHA